MNWLQVCKHPNLQNLPFKIELNERGQIIMSPMKVYHSAYQGEIGHLLRSLSKDGRMLVECAINTRKGTKVADVAWASKERFDKIRYETECSVAPEICVEVLSESNTDDEIKEKQKLYFEKGAKEVWICSRKGNMTFFSEKGKIKKSVLMPEFPKKIDM